MYDLQHNKYVKELYYSPKCHGIHPSYTNCIQGLRKLDFTFQIAILKLWMIYKIS